MFNIDKSLVRFMIDEPFYSNVLRHVSKVKDNSVQTIAVSVDREQLDFKLIYNEDFLSSLSKDQFRGVLIHECLHLIFCHITTRYREPQIIWNWATDLSINCMIPECMLPAGGLVPGKSFTDFNKLYDKEKLDLLKQSLGNEIVKKMRKEHEFLSDLIKSFPSYMSADWYFEQLIKHEDMFKSEAVPGLGFDDHIYVFDGTFSDSEIEIIKAKISEMTSNAVKRAKSNNAWGSVSANTKDSLNQMFSKDIKWQDVLAKFVGNSHCEISENSWSRINYRMPGVSQGFKRTTKSNIAIYIDQSGSVSNEELSVFASELDNLTGLTKFTIFPFDTTIKEGKEFKPGKFDSKKFARTACGGTDFDVVHTHAEALCKNKNIDGYLIFTDGECSKPKKSNHRRGWIFTAGSTPLFTPDKKDIVIQLG
jgi:predicted metal-dependent peptidase